MDAAPDVSVEDAGAMDAKADVRDAAGEVPPEMAGILVKGPDLLSQTGLYADIKTRTIAPGVIEFAPRWALWSDGADKRRWIQLPQGKTIDTTDMDQWVFPVGTKLWKEFTVSGKVVETRLLWKVDDKGWRYWWMASYRWRQDGSDADVVIYGDPNALGTGWEIPTQVDCVRCHFGIADVGIGFSAIQLSAPQNSQLSKFAGMGWFSKPPMQEFDAPGTGTEHDALAYMHANCGHCHVDTSQLYAQQTKLLLRLRTTDTTPQVTGAYAAIGMMAKHNYDPMYGAYNIVAGKPDQSQVWLRMNVRGYWQMPPIATKKIDMTGTSLVGQWIAGLPSPDM
jgi:hypothetical protein